MRLLRSIVTWTPAWPTYNWMTSRWTKKGMKRNRWERIQCQRCLRFLPFFSLARKKPTENLISKQLSSSNSFRSFAIPQWIWNFYGSNKGTSNLIGNFSEIKFEGKRDRNWVALIFFRDDVKERERKVSLPQPVFIQQRWKESFVYIEVEFCCRIRSRMQVPFPANANTHSTNTPEAFFSSHNPNTLFVRAFWFQSYSWPTLLAAARNKQKLLWGASEETAQRGRVKF